MNEVLIFSDPHIHAHKGMTNRLYDGLAVLEWVFRTAIERNIKTIICGGDLFQDRQKIHTITYEKTFNLIRKFMENNPQLSLYLLVGNHDMWFNDKWDVSSISPLGAIQGTTVVDKCCSLEVIPGCKVDFLPYTKNPVEDIDAHFKEKSDVLISHIAIDEAKLNSFTKSEVSVEHEGDMVKVDVSKFLGWKKVYLGHYHLAQKLNEVVEYVGSPYELNFGEAFQRKHIIVLNLDDLSCDYIVNDFSPKHLIVKEDQLNRHKLEGNFVKVVVDDITSTNIVDIRNGIENTASLEFEERKREKDEKVTDETQAKFNFSTGEILERYIKAKGHEGLDFDQLLVIGKTICQEVNS